MKCTQGQVQRVTPCTGSTPFCDPETLTCSSNISTCLRTRRASTNFKSAHICKDNTYIPDLLDCTKFSYCRRNNFYKYSCTRRTNFNPQSNSCERTSKCISFSNTTGCLGNVRAFVPYIQNETQFVFCGPNNTPRLKACPASTEEVKMVFDNDLQRCKAVCKAEGRFQDRNDPRRQGYFECGPSLIGTRLVCPRGTVFWPCLGICAFAEEGEDCTKLSPSICAPQDLGPSNVNLKMYQPVLQEGRGSTYKGIKDYFKTTTTITINNWCTTTSTSYSTLISLSTSVPATTTTITESSALTLETSTASDTYTCQFTSTQSPAVASTITTTTVLTVLVPSTSTTTITFSIPPNTLVISTTISSTSWATSTTATSTYTSTPTVTSTITECTSTSYTNLITENNAVSTTTVYTEISTDMMDTQTITITITTCLLRRGLIDPDQYIRSTRTRDASEGFSIEADKENDPFEEGTSFYVYDYGEQATHTATPLLNF